ncbi:MAG: hypothetical protein JNL39_01145 [Opitutaceae bacterium]|nr:hypothetical protein [Opitutaceae bacterium]
MSSLFQIVRRDCFRTAFLSVGAASVVAQTTRAFTFPSSGELCSAGPVQGRGGALYGTTEAGDFIQVGALAAQVAGTRGATGVALVEVYEVP